MTYHFNIDKRLIFVVLLFVVNLSLPAQHLISFNAERDDSFRDWIIDSDSTEFDGELYFRFTNDAFPRYWDYRTGELAGTIKSTWSGNPNNWLLDGLEINAEAKTTWRGQFDRWRVEIDGKQFIWKISQDDDGYFWEIEDKTNGSFFMYMEWENDMRDWIIEDYLAESFPWEGKVFLVFIAMFSHMVG
jgi:hypothetical protein